SRRRHTRWPRDWSSDVCSSDLIRLRQKGLEEARRNMELLQQIGGKRIAAPPMGATERTDLNLAAAAERYRALLELGAQMGVVPRSEERRVGKECGSRWLWSQDK